MAKYVIAGKSDCPFYARVELLADELQQRLPEFSVHKIVLTPEEWAEWVQNTCKVKGWTYNGASPIVWRELINRGGKGLLVGGPNEFLEIAKGYYGLTMDKITDELAQISRENKSAKITIDIQEEKRTKCSNPYRITVTNSHSLMAYNFLSHLCTAKLSKQTKDVFLTLFSSCMGEQRENINGVCMELFDCAESELRKVILQSDVSNAFVDANLVLILNSSEINKDSVEALKAYGTALNRVKNDAKIIVAGVQPMIACYIITQTADKVSKENFFALSRLQENHVKSCIAKKLSVNTSNISNIIIWGTSIEYILQHSSASVTQYDGAVWAPHLSDFSHSVNEMIYDKQWLTTELPKVLNIYKYTNDDNNGNDGDNDFDGSLSNGITTNGDNDDNSGDDKKGIEAKKNYISHTAALISQIEDLFSADKGELFSLGVVSNGYFGIPEGLVFSVPCTSSNGKVIVNKDIDLNDDMKSKIVDAAVKVKEYCDELMKTS